ncbi:hypothetical protein QOZ80_6BG0500960 [Eleusine coracana subsp. coracana]|nr:hypothetical protein QOZ80_6BG0500960 [Eleusine coracana subsp. coracana]
MAVRKAIEFVTELSYNQVILASEGLSLIQKLNSEALDRSETGTITQNIKLMADASPIVFSFIHVSRWSNVVAHILAKSVDQNSVSVWFDVAPEFIWTNLCNDRMDQ